MCDTPDTPKTKVAIIGSGNIGTDLMIKMLRISKTLECAAMVGIDPESDGLARAGRFKVPTTHEGVDGLIAMEHFDEIDIVMDATSAGAHRVNAAKLAPYGKKLVDLTPAAIGPFVVPVVNLETHEDADNVNMVTCGGQATIPIVYAVSRVTDVPYAEIVASVASKSAGPGTRANIDEFTETTPHGVEVIGGHAAKIRFVVTAVEDCQYDITIHGPENLVPGGSRLFGRVMLDDISDISIGAKALTSHVEGGGFCETGQRNTHCMVMHDPDFFGTVDPDRHREAVAFLQTEVCVAEQQ